MKNERKRTQATLSALSLFDVMCQYCVVGYIDIVATQPVQ